MLKDLARSALQSDTKPIHPQSRREVIGQILDYAKDLMNWSYDELDTKVCAINGGLSLFELVKADGHEVLEASFIDTVQRNLSKGRFLLLVVGDGIREGAFEIKDFLNTYASMEFSFAMVEVQIFHMPGEQLLVNPQVMRKTEITERRVISINQVSSEVTEKLESTNEQNESATNKGSGQSYEYWSALSFSAVILKFGNTSSCRRIDKITAIRNSRTIYAPPGTHANQRLAASNSALVSPA